MLEPKWNTRLSLEIFSVFYSTTNNICGSVEEFALEHFRSSADLPEGLHAEGAVFNTLCAVLFWAVISCYKIRKYVMCPNIFCFRCSTTR